MTALGAPTDSNDVANLETLLNDARRHPVEGDALHRLLSGSSPDSLEGSAAQLVALLEEPTFGRLSVGGALPARVSVVEALLRMGHPWALQLRAEDVAFRRSELRRRAVRRARRVAMSVFFIAGLAVAAWLLAPRETNGLPPDELENEATGFASFEESQLEGADLDELVWLLRDAAYRADEDGRPRLAARIAIDCFVHSNREECGLAEVSSRLRAHRAHRALGQLLHALARAEGTDRLALLERTRAALALDGLEADAATRNELRLTSKRALETGDRNGALAAALECIDVAADEPECHRIVLATSRSPRTQRRSIELLAWFHVRQRLVGMLDGVAVPLDGVREEVIWRPGLAVPEAPPRIPLVSTPKAARAQEVRWCRSCGFEDTRFEHAHDRVCPRCDEPWF